MLSLKLAFRGLWRHKVRTIITLLAVAFGQLMGLVFLTMNDGGHELMIELGVRQGRAGHVVVQAKDWQKTQSVELMVTDADRIRQVIRERLPKSRVVLRAFGGGLAKTASKAVGVLFAGVEPSREKHVTELADKIVQGVYLGASSDAITKAERKLKKKGALWCARPVGPDEPPRRQIVIGAQLAKSLKTDLCRRVNLRAQGLGKQEEAAFLVVGIFKTGSADMDGFFVHLALPDVQQLLHLGTGVHQVAVFVKSAKASKSAARAIRAAVPDRSLDVLAWDKALPEMAEFIWLDEASGYVFLIIVYLIIGIGILNTILMSVMERTREFGVMRALGAGPGRIVLLVLAEGMVIGLIGMIIGSLGSLPLVHYLETTGVDFAQWSDGEAMEAGGLAMTVIKGKLYMTSALWASGIIVGMSMLAAIYPAIRAAKVKVLKAIHQA